MSAIFKRCVLYSNPMIVINSLLQEAGLHVRQTFGIQDFEPTWAFITTWIGCFFEEYDDEPIYEGI